MKILCHDFGTAVLFLVGLIATSFSVACKAGPTSAVPEQGATSSRADTVVSLDVILAGPFAIVQQPDGLLILLPDATSHNKPVGMSIGEVNSKTFERGDYSFTKGIRPAKTTTVIHPVQGADVLSVSAAAEHLQSIPQEKPYFTIKVPIPREIVPWNADPIQVSPREIEQTTPSQRVATWVILRYGSDPADNLEMTGPPEFSWKPMAPLGTTERLVALVVDPIHSDDHHTAAKDVFKHLMKVLGLKRFIGFPTLPMAYQRNVPLLPNVIPDELIRQISGSRTSPAFSQYLFGNHNDCKAPAIMVTP